MVWMELRGCEYGLVDGEGEGGLRWCHAALLDDELAELQTDAAVVCSLGDQACGLSVDAR